VLASLEFLLTVGGSISGSFAGFSISLLVSLLLAISDSFTRDSDSEINWNYSQFLISQKKEGQNNQFLLFLKIHCHGGCTNIQVMIFEVQKQKSLPIGSNFVKIK
jgi:hypothetical protein